MDILFVVVFMLLGIVFFLLEIFFLPGVSFGVIIGTVFVGASVWYAFSTLGTVGGVIALVGGVVAMGFAIWGFIRSRMFEKMSLKSEIDATVPSVSDAIKVGDRGVSVSRLAPIGNVRFGAQTFEAKSDSGFIDPASTVEVVEVNKSEIIVKIVLN